MVIDKKTGVVEVEHALPAQSLTDPKTVHLQFRRIRMTAKGTYLAPPPRLNSWTNPASPSTPATCNGSPGQATMGANSQLRVV